MMVRAIGRRKKKEFEQNAKLMEAAVRNIAMFSAQTAEAAKSAANITLLGESEEPRPREPKTELILPPGVDKPRSNDEPIPDEERKVTPRVPAEDLNKVGSYERLRGMFGSSG